MINMDMMLNTLRKITCTARKLLLHFVHVINLKLFRCVKLSKILHVIILIVDSLWLPGLCWMCKSKGPSFICALGVQNAVNS